jgi:hypothetical protein
MWVTAVIGEPTHRHVVFQPVVLSRTYTVVTSSDLAASSWEPLPGSPPVSDTGNQRTVTDTGATTPGQFYRVQITKNSSAIKR